MLTITSWPISSPKWLNVLRRFASRPKWVTPAARQTRIQSVHLAFQRAYRRFAPLHPTWVQRRFDDHFLRSAATPRWAWFQLTGRSRSVLPTATALAWAWDNQFGVLAPNEATRSSWTAELIGIANCFLTLLKSELARLTTTDPGCQP